MPRPLALAPLRGLVLTGGASSRMGRDKATIAYHGAPQWQFLADSLRACDAEPYWSCTTSQADDWMLGDHAIHDIVPGHGPASGLHAAFSRDNHVAWLVVGCDYPWIDAQDLQRLVDARADNIEAIGYLNPDTQEIEPMIALWEPAAQQRFLQAFDRGGDSARHILRSCSLRLLDPRTRTALMNRNAGDTGPVDD